MDARTMKPMFPRMGAAAAGAPGSGRPPRDDMLPSSPAWQQDRACCCPAQPVVRAIMPPTSRRRHSVDLLLCDHHYRVSHQALVAADARIEYLRDKADAAQAALLRCVHPDHAEAS